MMRTIRVKVPAEGVLTTARDLQKWLGEIGFTISYFRYEIGNEGQPIEIDIQFFDDEEAEFFCNEFGGKFLTH